MKPTGFWIIVAVLLGWGALAFGAVYPWAYWPVIALGAALGACGLFASVTADGAPAPQKRDGATVTAAFVLTLAAVLLQLLPVSGQMLHAVSPTTDAVLKSYDVAYASGSPVHPLSISPQDTRVGLTFLASLFLFYAGTSRVLSVTGARTPGAAIVVLGVALALVGIIQAPMYQGKIYGFWKPQMGGSPFGPFVNKNHFAGWMVMALSLSLGYLCGRISRAMRGVRPTFRDRALWFASPDASQTVLCAMAAATMGLALVLTMSRSGIACFALAIAVTAVFVIRAQRGSRRVVTSGYLVLLVVIVVAWAGVDVIAQRFAQADWSEFNDRLGAWGDAWSVTRAFLPFGSGFNTYGVATLFYQTIDPTQHYAEAHNDYLQLLAEGGLLVGIPALLTVLAFVALVRRRFRARQDDTMTWWLRAGAVTGLVAIALQEVVEFSLQIPGNAVLFTVLAAIASHRAPPRPDARRP